MKVTIEIECTPIEARSFMGLPDLTPIHQMAITELEKYVTKSFGHLDPEQFFKSWLPTGMAGMEQFQRLFWQNLNSQAGGKNDPK